MKNNILRMTLLQRVKFAWDRQTQGLVLGAFFYGYTLTQIGSGLISDKFGGKRVLLLGLSWMSLLTLLTPVLTTLGGFAALFVIRVLEGMGSVCVATSDSQTFSRGFCVVECLRVMLTS